MLKKVLWIAAAAAAVLVALAVSRTLNFTGGEAPKAVPEAPAVEEAAAPVAAQVPEVKPAETTPPPAPPPTPEELQVQEDAAATGMTTLEPEEPPPEQPPT